jgi:hypothetical protein
MSAVSIFRGLLLVRGCWLLLEWFFGWGSHGHVDSFTLLHPYAALFAQALAVGALLVILAGLWFFRRWARLTFVFGLAVAVVYSAFRPHYSMSAPPSFVVAMASFVVMLNGAIVAMSFLPPVRQMFAIET